MPVSAQHPIHRKLRSIQVLVNGRLSAALAELEEIKRLGETDS